MKILITDPVDRSCIQTLEQEPEVEVEIRSGLSPAQLQGMIGRYEGIIVRSTTEVTKEVIQAAHRLKVIGRAGVGVDNIDVEAATRRGIIVMNAPEGNVISTAEHTLSLLLALARNIPQANHSLKQGGWDRERYLGVEVYGKTLGIIGLGRVGQEVAKRAKAFGMELLSYDPYIAEEVAAKLNVKLVSLKELLAQSHFITLHVPLTEDTRYMIGERELALCQDGVRIINCARGGIVDERALAWAIQSGKVAGAALDVFEEEPPQDNELLQLDRVIVTPHLGAATREAQANVGLAIAQQVIDFLKRGEIRNAVNAPSVDREILPKIRPYVDLAEKIGSLQAQLMEGQLREVTVEFQGEVLDYPTEPITISVLKGMFQHILSESVNYVNASHIARERGVKVNEVRSSEHEDFTNLITVVVQTDRGRRLTSGTLFSRKDPRIVRIDDFHFDAIPKGYLLIYSHIDVPGMIGQVGTILGQNGINIGGMFVARKRIGGRQMTVMNVDSPVSKEVLDQILSVEGFFDVKVVKL